MDTSINYYSLLGVKRAATPAEIKRAYRQMVFRYHPDRNPGDDDAADKFKQVLDAYSVLSDGEKRSVYDAVTKPAGAEEEPPEEDEPEEEESKPEFGAGVGNGFNFSQEFKQKTQPEPKCPSCSIVGTEHLIARKGGAATSRGKQFIMAPFSVVFCDTCGHIYGVTPNSG